MTLSLLPRLKIFAVFIRASCSGYTLIYILAVQEYDFFLLPRNPNSHLHLKHLDTITL